jgi:hypothetical protein
VIGGFDYESSSKGLDTYITNALNGEILDKKAKKIVEKELG